MKKLLTILIAALFAATNFGAIAQDAPKGEKVEKKAKAEKKVKVKKSAKKAEEKK